MDFETFLEQRKSWHQIYIKQHSLHDRFLSLHYHPRSPDATSKSVVCENAMYFKLRFHGEGFSPKRHHKLPINCFIEAISDNKLTQPFVICSRYSCRNSTILRRSSIEGQDGIVLLFSRDLTQGSSHQTITIGTTNSPSSASLSSFFTTGPTFLLHFSIFKSHSCICCAEPFICSLSQRLSSRI